MTEERIATVAQNATVKADCSSPALVLPAGVLWVEARSAAGRRSCSQSTKSHRQFVGLRPSPPAHSHPSHCLHRSICASAAGVLF